MGDGANRTRGFSEELIQVDPSKFGSQSILADRAIEIEPGGAETEETTGVGTRVLLTVAGVEFIFVIRCGPRCANGIGRDIGRCVSLTGR